MMRIVSLSTALLLALCAVPAFADEEPSAAAEEPLATAEEPLAAAEEPLATAEEPLVTAEEPLAAAEEPMTPAEEPLATVDGTPIYESELVVNAQWRKLDRELHSLRLEALGAKIAATLLSREAERQGVSVTELINSVVGPKVGEPTNKEIADFYKERSAQIGRPLKEVREEIVAVLRRDRGTTHLNDFVAELRNGSEITILLAPPRLPVNLENVRQRGPEDAPVTVVEFSDFQCPFCRKAQAVFAELQDEFKDSVRWVFKDLPLTDIHPEAERAAQAARCAGEQDKFWEYRALLYDNDLFTDATYTEVAEKAEVDPGPLMECLSSGEQRGPVLIEAAEARNLGIEGTPAILINGILVTGARDIAVYRRMIEAEIEKSASP